VGAAHTGGMTALAGGRFQPFGPQHLVILGIFGLVCLAVVFFVRRLSPGGEATVRRATGAVILVVCGPFEVVDGLHAVGNWRTSLPLQICDFAWLIAGVALLTGSPRWSAVLYYWGLTLSLQGVLTPDLNHVFPDPQFFGYWVRHLAPVWAAVYLIGARAGPTWRDYRFVLALTALWAAAMMGLNAALGSDYGYLNAKPVSHSLLDILGPWPWYVVVEAMLIVVGWAVITLPWTYWRANEGGLSHRDPQGLATGESRRGPQSNVMNRWLHSRTRMKL
jgi:hypothetical integral membrane protein (TIGR02206 family)